jgi:hypothetical protein
MDSGQPLRGFRNDKELRLDREFEPAGGLQGPGIEGADLGRAGNVDDDDDTVAGDRGRNDACALGQQGGGLEQRTSPAAENPIPDDPDDHRDAEQRRETGNEHQSPDVADQLLLLG